MKRTHSIVRLLILSSLAWICCAAGIYGAEKNAAYKAAYESITGADMKAYVERLADAKMEGREAGTRGGRAASDYLAEQFAKCNLRPAAPGNKFEQPFASNYRNILGLIPGGDPQLKDEVIIVSAHYDHVGYGNRGNSYGPRNRIHPGADDNASGASALMELAKAFGFLPDPPKRSILVAAWDAEEIGLLGSKHWVSHPTVPLDKVVACFDLDMIGHLRDDRLYVFGSRSGFGWRRLFAKQNDEPGLLINFSWELKPVDDYYPFYERGIPGVMLHTGLHENYHRPSDTADLINGEGMSRVVRLLFGAVYELAESDEKIAYRHGAQRDTPDMEKRIAAQIAVPAGRLGVVLDAKQTPEDGVGLIRVDADSPAAKAGLKPGDRVLACAGREMHNDDELVGAIMTADSPMTIKYLRTGEEKPAEISVDLAGRPLRLGITWRVDETEPGAIILSYIIPGTPAARAGLRAGDRIYQVAGRDFADETAFADLVKSPPENLELLIERDGKIRTVIIRIKAAEELNRAA